MSCHRGRGRRGRLGREMGDSEELAGIGEPVGKDGIAFIKATGHAGEDLAGFGGCGERPGDGDGLLDDGCAWSGLGA